MNYATLFIEPADVWFFRTGKPFSAGEDQWAETVFPPTPYTLQGAIRSRVLAELGNLSAPNDNLIGSPGNYGKLRLCGPFVACCENNQIRRYFPPPADLVVPKEGPQKHPRQLRPGRWETAKTDMPSDLQPLLLPPELGGVVEAFSGWLNEEQFRSYLAGQLSAESVQSVKLWEKEYRLGIGMNTAQRTTRQQHLYQVSFIRLKSGAGLAVEIGVEGESDPLKQLKLPDEGYLALGGEARAAYFKKVDNLPSLPQEISGQQFTLYFATPAYFKNGWQPESWSKFFEGGAVELIAAAVGRPQLIGGWDLAKRASKPIRRYVPAGSVYYFKVKSGTVSLNLPVTDDPGDGQIGFGQVCVGQYSEIG